MEQWRIDRVMAMMPHLLNQTVVLVPDVDQWVMQSQEIDCAAQGPTPRHAVNAFKRVFLCTVLLTNLRESGLPKRCPKAVWSDLTQRQGAVVAVMSFGIEAKGEVCNEGTASRTVVL